MELSLKLILFLFNQIISCLSFQIVAPGPCIDEPDNYCAKLVPNSFCSPDKDACFCRSGYVGIKEKFGLVCKHLLTNLKCSMDKDCTDVAGSTCHPGQAQCSCPQETFYVSQEHMCKYIAHIHINKSRPSIPSFSNGPKYSHKDILLCNQCKLVTGRCYRDTVNQNRFPDDRSSLSLSSNSVASSSSSSSSSDSMYNRRNNFFKRTKYVAKCSCPGISFTPKTPSALEIPNQPSVCYGIMADLGSYCNNVDIVCRAKLAECKESKLHQHKICSCPSNYVAVYQEHMGYFDCYLIVERRSKFCEHCRANNKHCVDMNSDGNEDACVCDKWNLVYAQPDLDYSDFFCRDSSVSISCTSHNMEICLNLHTIFPTKTISLNEYMQISYHSPKPINQNKRRLQYNNQSSEIPICIQPGTKKQVLQHCFSIPYTENTKQCIVRNDKSENSKHFRLSLSVERVSSYRELVSQLSYDASCISRREKNKPAFGHFADKSWNGQISTITPENIRFKSDLITFHFLDLNSKRVQYIKPEQTVIIDIFIKKNQGYIGILTEECRIKQSNKFYIIYNRLKTIRQSDYTNDEQYNKLAFTAIPNSDPMKSFSVRSNAFPAYIMKMQGKLKFSCTLRLCSKSYWCNEILNWHMRDFQKRPPPNNYDEIKFIDVESEITIQSNKCCPVTSIAKEKKSTCSDLFCLTPAQILTIVISVCTLAILLSFIIILLFKKTHHFRSILRSSNSSNQNTSTNTSSKYTLCTPKDTLHHSQPQNLDSFLMTNLSSSTSSSSNHKYSPYSTHLAASYHDHISPQQHTLLESPTQDDPQIIITHNKYTTNPHILTTTNDNNNNITLAKEYDFYVNLSALHHTNTLNSNIHTPYTTSTILPPQNIIFQPTQHSRIIENQCSIHTPHSNVQLESIPNTISRHTLSNTSTNTPPTITTITPTTSTLMTDAINTPYLTLSRTFIPNEALQSPSVRQIPSTEETYNNTNTSNTDTYKHVTKSTAV